MSLCHVCEHICHVCLKMISCVSAGTDIIRKQIENNELDYDFSHVTGLANHQPYRSKSLNSPNPRHESHDPHGLSSLAALQGEGQNRMANDYSHHQQVHKMTDGPGGLMVDQMQALNVSQHSRSPSLKVRRYSFLAGSRRGRGFSEIFNSTILNDHFDQYSANDSNVGCDGLGVHFNSLSSSSSSNPHSYSNHNPRVRPPPANPSPDSGVSESMDEDASKTRSLQRRRTMPCIIDSSVTTKHIHPASAKQFLAEHETAHSSENLSNTSPDTFIIENGIRKRIEAEVHSNPSREYGHFPTEYKFVDDQKLAGSSGVDKRGSLPDLKTVTSVKPMSRREAYQLGSARREEIRRLQELAERRRQGDMSVILGDVRVSGTFVVPMSVILRDVRVNGTFVVPMSVLPGTCAYIWSKCGGLIRSHEILPIH